MSAPRPLTRHGSTGAAASPRWATCPALVTSSSAPQLKFPFFAPSFLPQPPLQTASPRPLAYLGPASRAVPVAAPAAAVAQIAEPVEEQQQKQQQQKQQIAQIVPVAAAVAPMAAVDPVAAVAEEEEAAAQIAEPATDVMDDLDPQEMWQQILAPDQDVDPQMLQEIQAPEQMGTVRLGDHLEYYSAKHGWIPTKVVNVVQGRVMVDCKPKKLLSVDQQWRLRFPGQVDKTLPCQKVRRVEGADIIEPLSLIEEEEDSGHCSGLSMDKDVQDGEHEQLASEQQEVQRLLTELQRDEELEQLTFQEQEAGWELQEEELLIQQQTSKLERAEEERLLGEEQERLEQVLQDEKAAYLTLQQARLEQVEALAHLLQVEHDLETARGEHDRQQQEEEQKELQGPEEQQQYQQQQQQQQEESSKQQQQQQEHHQQQEHEALLQQEQPEQQQPEEHHQQQEDAGAPSAQREELPLEEEQPDEQPEKREEQLEEQLQEEQPEKQQQQEQQQEKQQQQKQLRLPEEQHEEAHKQEEQPQQQQLESELQPHVQQQPQQQQQQQQQEQQDSSQLQNDTDKAATAAASAKATNMSLADFESSISSLRMTEPREQEQGAELERQPGVVPKQKFELEPVIQVSGDGSVDVTVSEIKNNNKNNSNNNNSNTNNKNNNNNNNNNSNNKNNNRGRWKIAEIAEHRVLGAGVRRLHQELVADALQRQELDLLDFPKRADGSSFVMQASFFRRLLGGLLEVKCCLESDISAAHYDLRHLRLEQLVALRFQCLDFVTASDSHSTHSNFLDSVDAFLAEKLVKRTLTSDVVPPVKPELVRALGRRLVLALGAGELLQEGWGSSVGTSGVSSSPSNFAPPCWAIDLEAGAWQGHQVALFRADTMQVLLPGDRNGPQRSAWVPAVGSHFAVAVICDSSSGFGRTRRFQWEVAVLDPRTDDVLQAATSTAVDPGAQQQQLVKALAARLQKRQGLEKSDIASVPRPLFCPRNPLGTVAEGGSPPEVRVEAEPAASLARPSRPSVARLQGRVAAAVARIHDRS
ncbi:unnamed protein product [Polarella glacialis]|uniref:Uncharacterized protein n=2 Tax=Polarella glacialis TaxID=89957 RepID=A0A813H6J8_POLGL|nr:unnamed protein product [Polarella glacialis]